MARNSFIVLLLILSVSSFDVYYNSITLYAWGPELLLDITKKKFKKSSKKTTLRSPVQKPT